MAHYGEDNDYSHYDDDDEGPLSPFEEALGGRFGDVTTPPSQEAIDIYESGGADYGEPSGISVGGDSGVERTPPIPATTDKPNEIPSISDVSPTRPIDYGDRQNTGAAPVTSDLNTPSDSDGGGANYTPARPRQPRSSPGAFSSMPYDPTLGNASPAAQSVSLRAPFISSPAQYNPAGGAGARLRSVTGGLTRGGLGVAGGNRDIDTILSSLLQAILGQRR